MYLSLIITFLLLLGIIIAGVQNATPLELKFIAWKLQMSLTALIFYSSLFGGSIVAVLALPKCLDSQILSSMTRDVLSTFAYSALSPE
jgi:uncharacterized integral membrane protein